APFVVDVPAPRREHDDCVARRVAERLAALARRSQRLDELLRRIERVRRGIAAQTRRYLDLAPFGACDDPRADEQHEQHERDGQSARPLHAAALRSSAANSAHNACTTPAAGARAPYTAPVHVSTRSVVYFAAAGGTRSLASARHSPSVDDARIGTVCTCTRRDSVPRYKSASAARCSPRSQRASAAAPTSSGKLSGRMSRSRTWLGATNFFGTRGTPRSPTSRAMKTTSSTAAIAPTTQTSKRPDSAIQANKPRDHCASDHHQGSSVTASCFFHRSELILRTVARF